MYQNQGLGGYVRLLGTLPDTELTLTHFDDGRATDEEVLKEEARSRNLNYKSWQAFLDQSMIDIEEKKTVRIVTGSLYFLSQVRAYLMERKTREWIHKRLKQL